MDCITNKGYDSWNDKIVHGERLGCEILLGLAGCRVVNAWFLCVSNLGCWALTDFVKFRCRPGGYLTHTLKRSDLYFFQTESKPSYPAAARLGFAWLISLWWVPKLIKLMSCWFSLGCLTWVDHGNTTLSTIVHRLRCKIDCNCRRPDVSEPSLLLCITVPQHPHFLRDCDAKQCARRLLRVVESHAAQWCAITTSSCARYLLWTGWPTPAAVVWFRSPIHQRTMITWSQQLILIIHCTSLLIIIWIYQPWLPFMKGWG